MILPSIDSLELLLSHLKVFKDIKILNLVIGKGDKALILVNEFGSTYICLIDVIEMKLLTEMYLRGNVSKYASIACIEVWGCIKNYPLINLIYENNKYRFNWNHIAKWDEKLESYQVKGFIK